MLYFQQLTLHFQTHDTFPNTCYISKHATFLNFKHLYIIQQTCYILPKYMLHYQHHTLYVQIHTIFLNISKHMLHLKKKTQSELLNKCNI